MRKKEPVEKILFNMTDAAAAIGVHPRTISRYLNSGKLKGARFGKEWRISREDIQKMYDTQKALTAKELKEAAAKKAGEQ